MTTLTRTYLPKKDGIVRKWHLLDGQDFVLGRLATKAAGILCGKIKPIYTPHLDTGDFAVVVNAEKVRLTGNKLQQKIDFRHSGYPGGDKYMLYDELMKKNPEKAVRLAVKGMLPKNRLGAKMIKRLNIYKGPTHPHAAQFNAGMGKKTEKTEK
ncbi:MAG: 50S ribosomal protein L13 [Elusimicrobiota bacterium]